MLFFTKSRRSDLDCDFRQPILASSRNHPRIRSIAAQLSNPLQEPRFQIGCKLPATLALPIGQTLSAHSRANIVAIRFVVITLKGGNLANLRFAGRGVGVCRESRSVGATHLAVRDSLDCAGPIRVVTQRDNSSMTATTLKELLVQGPGPNGQAARRRRLACDAEGGAGPGPREASQAAAANRGAAVRSRPAARTGDCRKSAIKNRSTKPIRWSIGDRRSRRRKTSARAGQLGRRAANATGSS